MLNETFSVIFKHRAQTELMFSSKIFLYFGQIQILNSVNYMDSSWDFFCDFQPLCYISWYIIGEKRAGWCAIQFLKSLTR